ncbi:MAG: YedE family putative selenium transporter [Clostridiaceae bacterium]|nr:YedE-related selenium metabolism membrane protein [Eubacteriales bacterium]
MGKQNWFNRNWLLIVTGVVVGAAAILLSALGNPKNMGFCIACFERDIAGSLGLHSAGKVQYFRPEIVGILLGSMAMALFRKEFRGKAGSSPVIRFFLGAVTMIGALMFLGCPLRMMIRIGGGDLNAVVGLFGFIAGILAGVFFLKRGFSLQRAYEQAPAEAAAFPASMLLFLILSLTGIGGLILSSAEGPGSMHAPWYIAIIAGLVVGALAQRSRLCTAGGIRDAVMFKDFGLVAGFAAVIATVFIGNVLLGKFTGFSFADQPVAHTDGLWNFLGMALVGWCAILLGGCPLRQLVLAGEGNSDSAVTVLGMLAGAALSHNFGLASSAEGPTANGKVAVIAGFAVLTAVSLALTLHNRKGQKNG